MAYLLGWICDRCIIAQEGGLGNKGPMGRPGERQILLPLIIGLLIRWRYDDLAARWQPHLSRFSLYSLMLMAVAGLPAALPSVLSTVGSWLIVGAILLALGTGQRNLAATLLVAAHGFGGDVFANTMVACVVLTIAMHVIAAEWGRRANKTSKVS